MMNSEKSHDAEAPTQEIPDYNLRIRELIMESDMPEGVVSTGGIELSSLLLDQVHEKYSDPTSPEYKPYHNAQHSLNVLRRSWKLWGLLQEKLPEKFDNSGYELLMLASCGHDLFVSTNIQTGEDERHSAEFTEGIMLKNGYSKKDARRVQGAIEASAVERDEQGTIVQSNIQSGNKDTLKLVFATADINGIAMEGPHVMLQDAINLYMEFSGATMKEIKHNPKGAINFMLTQAKFLEDRLGARNGDLLYYLDEDEFNIVRKVYKKEFSSSTREALILAQQMHDFPGLASDGLKKVLQATGESAISISSLPREIGKTLTGRGKGKEE